MNNGGNMYDFSNDLRRQQNPYNQNMMMRQQPMPKKKHGGGIFIIFLLLIITFLVLYIVDLKKIYNIPYMDKVDNFISSKFVKPADGEDEEKKEQKVQEVEITEQKTKEELMNKVLFLSTLDATPTSKTTIFAKDLKVEDLSDTQKLRIATYGLNAVEDKYAVVNDKEELKAVYPDLPEEQLVDIKAIAATAVNNRYLGIFGVKPTAASITEGCPTFTYSEKTNKYYLNTKCSEEVSNEKIHVYAYNFSKDEKYNYVYLAIGVSKLEGEEATIYSDYAMEHEMKVITKEELETFKISNDNLDGFSKYKFYFVKNESANYVFEKVEQIKEDK